MLSCMKCEEKRSQINCMVAGVAGLLFITGWWLLIDAHATNPAFIDGHREYYAPGVVATAAMFVVNAIPMAAVSSGGMNMYTSNKGARAFAIIALFVAFVAAFGCMIAATYVLFSGHVLLRQTHQLWPGVALFLQNALILTSNVVLKFGTATTDFI